MSRPPEQVLRTADRFHPTGVYRVGEVVLREARPWSATVQALLRHLARVGFAAAPRVLEPGFDEHGRETLTFIHGDVRSAGPWSPEGAFAIGQLFRALHEATAGWIPPPDAVWYPWFGRDLRGRHRVIGHCDPGPRNIVSRGGLPVALIDWEWAGPVDPLIELAQVCWLNACLHDDIVAERERLPSAAERGRHLRAIVDGYGLPPAQWQGFVTLITEFAVHDTAAEADRAAVRPESSPVDLDRQLPWALAWRARLLPGSCAIAPLGNKRSPERPLRWPAGRATQVLHRLRAAGPSETAANDVGLPAQPPGGQVDLLVQVPQGRATQVPPHDVLGVLPDAFVRRWTTSPLRRLASCTWRNNRPSGVLALIAER